MLVKTKVWEGTGRETEVERLVREVTGVKEPMTAATVEVEPSTMAVSAVPVACPAAIWTKEPMEAAADVAATAVLVTSIADAAVEESITIGVKDASGCEAFEMATGGT